MSKNKEVREIEIQLKTTGVEESEKKLKKLKTATREQEEALNRLKKASIGAQARMNEAIKGMTPKNIDKANKRIRGIKRELEYASKPKNIGYEKTNKFAKKGFTGSVGSGPKRRSVIKRAVDSNAIIGAKQRVNVKKFSDYAQQGYTRLLQGPKYSMPDALKSLTNFRSPRPIVSQDDGRRMASRANQYLSGYNKYTSIFATGKRTPAMIEAEKAHDLRQKVIKPSSGKGMTQGASISQEHQNMMKDWSEAIKMNAKFDKNILKEKEDAYNSDWSKAIKMNAEFDKKKREQNKKESDARLNLGKQQQSDYFARAKSNMAKYKKEQKLKAKEKGPWERFSKGSSKFSEGIGKINSSIVGAVGKLTLFVGAINMIGYTASLAFQKMMAVGDAFASVESDFLVGAGYREGLISEGGISKVAGFDRANELNQKYSGLDQFSSGAQLARVGNSIQEEGGSVNERSLTNVIRVGHGASALTGKSSEDMQRMAIEVAKKGKGAEKLGLKKDLKLIGTLNEKLEQLEQAISKNSIAMTALNRTTIQASMQNIRSSGRQLMGGVLGEHGKQASDTFETVGNAFKKVSKNKDVIKKWASVLTNLQKTVEAVFTDDFMKKSADGMAQWSAELINIGGWMIKGFGWFLQNSKFILEWAERFAWVLASLKVVAIGASTIDKFNKFNEFFNKLGGLGQAATGAVVGVTAGLLAINQMYDDFKKGQKWSEETGKAGKTQAGIGFALGGEGSGVSGAIGGAMKGGLAGISIGAFAGPIGMAIGGAVGSVIGAVFGYIGGEKISVWLQEQTDMLKAEWQEAGEILNSGWQGVMNVFRHVGDSIMDIWTGLLEGIKTRVDKIKGFATSIKDKLTFNSPEKTNVTLSDSLNNTPSINNPVLPSGGVGASREPYTNPANHWNNPNATVLVLNNSELVIDGKLGATEEQFVSMAGN